jgi:formylglycine-generating enzyme required for sulfatase activity
MNEQPPNTQALPAGTRLEEFVIERVLGAGGFGITYLAMDTHLGRKVVIKENLPAQFCFRNPSSMSVSPRHTHGDDADNFLWSLENFSKEASMLASLDHPGIVKVLRSFQALGTAYFVMPYVEGVALDELAKQRQGKPFTEAELRGLLERVLSALGYLHERGIYHRDIKPGNILITSEGNSVLIDFGSARQRLSERSMTVVESAGYTPFEQLQSRGNVGPWSDLYALGATLEKILTGEAPPKAADRVMGDPRRELCGNPLFNQHYSLSFLRAIDIAVSVNPQQRWKSCDEWLLGLKEISSSNTNPSKPPVREPAKTAPLPYSGQEQNAHKSSKAERRRLSKADGNWLVFGVCGLVILSLAVVVIKSSDNSDGVAQKRIEEPEKQLPESEKQQPEPEKQQPEPVNPKFDGKIAGEERVVEISRGVKMTFCWCPAGDFTMGSPESEEGRSSDEKQVKVTLTKGFWMAKTEVTQAQWTAIMDNNPSRFNGNDLPVENVSWEDAQEFIKKVNDSGVMPEGWNVCLQTEAQWEYACRAGETGSYSGGTIDQVAWYDDNSGSKTHDVGTKKSNAWGLHDMHGNVWEWCADCYDEELSGGSDPSGPSSGVRRVSRGGSWFSFAANCRAALRSRRNPGIRDGNLGFRPALVPSE